MSEHTISQLSALTGMPVRTIRYYLAQGLLPAAGKEGPGTRYPEATLARLRLVARLRDAHLPLAEIRKQLLALSDDQVVELAGTPAEPEPAGSALDYVRQVLGGGRPELTPLHQASSPLAVRTRPVMPPPASRRPLAASGPAAPLSPASSVAPTPAPDPQRPPAPARAMLLRRAELVAPSEAAAPPEATSVFGQRSQWERVAITSDIELHVRRPLSRRDNRLVDRLVSFARQLQEEQP